MDYICSDCPRKCKSRRNENIFGGFCGSCSLPFIARAAPHFGEEPCISGTKGSGAVFFSGCSLRCVFCQNREISTRPFGRKVNVSEFRDILLRLRDTGVHNINLVTPTHFTRFIAEALSGLDLGIPVVWNSSGYESVESLRMLEGLVQIYMPDFKYCDSALASRFSSAPGYPETAREAVMEMFRQRGPYRMREDGILESGVLVRHLILPGHTENSMDVIDFIADSFSSGDVLFSLMAQYTPVAASAYPELLETVSPEYNAMLRHYMSVRGITDGYWQDASSATEEMIPEWDLTGVDE